MTATAPDARADRRLERVPAFDSLRAVAILLVLVLHLWAVFPLRGVRWSQAGFLGVDLFFVLSGFLITALLVQERRATGGVGIRRFYARRALRLLPALAFFLTAYLVYGATNDWPPFGRRDFAIDSIGATLLYVMNWRVLWNPLAAGDLTALWSLSIEEQFYLVWPALLLGLVAWRRRLPAVAVVVGVAAVIVTVWRAIVFHTWGWQSAYLRTDCRIDGLLWGSLAALLWTSGRLPTRLPRWTTPAVIALWVVLLATVRADHAWAYEGGITLWVLSAAVLIVHFANQPERHGQGPLARATRAVGRVSYAGYLWQLPCLWAAARWWPDWPVVLRAGAGVAMVVIGTVASWVLIERPALALKQRAVSADRGG